MLDAWYAQQQKKREAHIAWLDALRPGSKVAVSTYGDTYLLLTVAKRTPKQVVLSDGRRYWTKDGERVGSSSGYRSHGSYLENPDSEKVKEALATAQETAERNRLFKELEWACNRNFYRSAPLQDVKRVASLIRSFRESYESSANATLPS